MSAGTDALGGHAVPTQFGRKLLVQIGAFASLTIVCLALWVVYRPGAGRAPGYLGRGPSATGH